MVTLNSEIESKLIKAGASLIGFADISDLSADVTGSMTSAVSIAVALNTSIINEISNGPTERYYQEYKRVNGFLAHLSETTVEYLKGRGNRALAIKPTVEGKDLDYKTLTTSLPHKTVARCAGLGWIGKSALLITKKYGAAVRFATVLTDAELEAAEPLNASSCGDCNKCVENCPAKAISGRNWELGLEREMIYDAFACCDTATRLSKKVGISSVICGICINVCPWTQKYISAKLITYYLEMKSPGELRCSRNVNPELEVKQVLNPSPELNRFFYSAVGKDWYWTGRLKWSEEQWLEYLDRPELETWVVYVSGQQAGYFELEMQSGANVEIAYFGLLPEFIGQGIGGQLLTAATERAWKMGAGRVWVHTNTRDHPHALSNYEARGFLIFKEEEKYIDLPDGEAGV